MDKLERDVDNIDTRLSSHRDKLSDYHDELRQYARATEMACRNREEKWTAAQEHLMGGNQRMVRLLKSLGAKDDY